MDFPAFIFHLLSEDYFFFNDDDIAWDGKHHQIVGIQVNALKAPELQSALEAGLAGFDSLEELANYLIAFMSHAEQDEGLIVPRNRIAQGVRKGIREGDLTGITLMNLAACAQALVVDSAEDNVYRVMFDTRLPMGIPQFFTLVARLIWDVRDAVASLAGVPFTVVFMGARNFDADAVFGNVNKNVVGAQSNPETMTVASRPAVDLDAVE